MTTILGLRSGGVSYLAADSRICAGNPIPTKARKIIESGPWAVASSGFSRLANVVAEQDFSEVSSIAELTRQIKRAVATDDWSKGTEAGPAGFGNIALLVASAAGVWYVACDFSYAALEDDRAWGTGSGAEYGEGAATALLTCGWAPGAALPEAIRIASRYDPGTDDRVQAVRLGVAAPQDRSPVFISREQLIAPLPPEEEAKLRRVTRSFGHGPNGA